MHWSTTTIVTNNELTYDRGVSIESKRTFKSSTKGKYTLCHFLNKTQVILAQ